MVSGNSQCPWCISGEVSASRALALIACLRALTHFGGGSYASHRLSMLNSPSDSADPTNTVVAFYATSLSHTVGRGYVPPSLSSLARWWFDVSSMTLFTHFFSLYLLRLAFCFVGELRLAARTLFDAGVAGLTDEETTSLVDRWQHSRKFCYLAAPGDDGSCRDRTVPFLLPDAEKRSPVASKALLLCGFIAARQHSLLSTRLAFPLLHR